MLIKRVLCVIAACCLALSLSACKPSDQNEETGDTPLPYYDDIRMDESLFDCYAFDNAYRDDFPHSLVCSSVIKTVEPTASHYYFDEETEWRVDFTEFRIADIFPVSDGVIAIGNTDINSSEEVDYLWIAKVSDNGEKEWVKRRDPGLKFEWLADVFENSDKSVTLISDGRRKNDETLGTDFFATKYDRNGNEIFSKNIGYVSNDMFIPNMQFCKCKDGFLWQRCTNEGAAEFKYFSGDGDIVLSKTVDLSKDGYSYFLSECAELCGEVIFSVQYALGDDMQGNWRSIIDHALETIMDENSSFQIMESEKIAPLVREGIYTVLYSCDVNTLEVKEVYNVSESLSGKLYVKKGRLIWDTEYPDSLYYSPMTSSFTIGGISKVIRYVFDSDKHLQKSGDSGFTADFRC